jgi:hypothetical protein
LLDLAKIGREMQVWRVALDPGGWHERSWRGRSAERKGVGCCGRWRAWMDHGDPDALDKVLVNTVGNALKFTEAGGRIEVSVRREGEWARLSVADTGVGIPAEQLERIFDRFAQVDDSATRKHEGTGIGLSLVRELVELHGGRVWAESAGAGQGATLHVVLPRGGRTPPRRGPARAAATAGSGARLRRWRRSSFPRDLAPSGWRTSKATSALRRAPRGW